LPRRVSIAHNFRRFDTPAALFYDAKMALQDTV
jgi:hypothetical protein